MEGTSTPIGGVELTFYSFLPSGEFGTPGSYKLIATVETNSNGEYSITYDETFQTISIAAFKEGYFECRHPNTCLPAFSQEGEFERDLFLEAEAYLRVQLVDTKPMNDQNFMTLSPGFFDNALQSYLITESGIIEGTIKSNIYHSYFYDTEGIRIVDSVFIDPLATQLIIIEF